MKVICIERTVSLNPKNGGNQLEAATRTEAVFSRERMTRSLSLSTFIRVNLTQRLDPLSTFHILTGIKL